LKLKLRALEEEAMKKVWIALLAPPAVVLFVWLCGEVVMHLWNWLLPPLFGWHVVTFWQALGLLLLTRILFGGHGMGHKGGGGGPKRWQKRKWDRMTPEEREQFRGRYQGWCGPGAGSQRDGESAG
jgi:hypothetical protein